jgi:hypothetical protein
MVFKFSRIQLLRRVWPFICPIILGIPGGILYGIYYASDYTYYLEYSERVIYGEITISGFHASTHSSELALDGPRFNGTGYAMGKWYTIDTKCKTWSGWFPARRFIEETGCQECEICYSAERMKQFENGCSRDSINKCRQERQNTCIGDIIKSLYPKVRGFTNVFNPCEEIQIGSKLGGGDVPYTDTGGAYAGFIIAYMFAGMFAFVVLIPVCCLMWDLYMDPYSLPSWFPDDVPVKSLVKYQKEHPWFRRFVSVVCCTCFTSPIKKTPNETSHTISDKDSTEPTPLSLRDDGEVPITRPTKDIPPNLREETPVPEEIENLRKRHSPGDNILARYDLYKSFQSKPVLPRQIPETENRHCFISEKPIRGVFFHCPTCSINASFPAIFPFVMNNYKCPKCETRMSSLYTDLGEHLYGYVKYE